jgi:hypothetical protein
VTAHTAIPILKRVESVPNRMGVSPDVDSVENKG